MSKKKARVITALRTPQGFTPRSEFDWEQIAKIKIGAQCTMEIKEQRNPHFHNMVMSLLRFGYQQWDAGADVSGQYRDFDVFRDEVTILAGFYTVYFSMLDQRLHYKAESISYGNMSQQRFEAYFTAIKRVIWREIFAKQATYTEQDFENVVAQLMNYDR